LAAFFAMLAAASYAQLADVPIQAGVSAILVVALGPAITGSVRIADIGKIRAEQRLVSPRSTGRASQSG
jgi:hypothetical protein